jgi:uncharacterized protein (TIGR02246 family)
MNLSCAASTVVFSITLALGLPGCGAPEAAPAPAPVVEAPDRAADEAGIRALVQQLSTSINARQFATLAARRFTANADMIVGTNQKVTGWQAIQDAMVDAWADAPAERQMTVHIDSFRFLTADVAVVDTTADFTTDEPIAQERQSLVAVRGLTGWRIAAFRVYSARD